MLRSALLGGLEKPDPMKHNLSFYDLSKFFQKIGQVKNSMTSIFISSLSVHITPIIKKIYLLNKKEIIAG